MTNGNPRRLSRREQKLDHAIATARWQRRALRNADVPATRSLIRRTDFVLLAGTSAGAANGEVWDRNDLPADADPDAIVPVVFVGELRVDPDIDPLTLTETVTMLTTAGVHVTRVDGTRPNIEPDTTLAVWSEDKS